MMEEATMMMEETMMEETMMEDTMMEETTMMMVEDLPRRWPRDPSAAAAWLQARVSWRSPFGRWGGTHDPQR